ncbi:STAS/SEC14 domain-containing protein [Limibaculum sp. M0105]|uniref:STAS/SEC14 domain-containing protein n=1 Tax=Thermohalobaculum xanthum TaxID=2753746 RepID=A0A8J7M4S4_9RHOB|nr:STAS/SEC14 domain-containing protein [Thermohalobaculum xanthum]MBK0398294.1 STAS/SEC14 domain-containing protein [Thermohalobaculum xanthum]
MIRTEWLREDEVLAIRPDGEIDDDDFKSVAKVIDPVIARRGRLEGLLVDARGFQGWDDTKALIAHLRFVHAHQPKVARIAIAGDQWWLRAAPMMEPLYGTPIRTFAASDQDAAKAWLLESEPEPPNVAILPESRGDVVGIRVTGRLREDDYDAMQAELTRRLPQDGKLRLLAIIDDDFRGWTPKACLDDIAMAFSPWRDRVGKLAVVAGPGLVRWCAEHFPRGLLPYPLKVFEPAELDQAWEWLRA